MLKHAEASNLFYVTGEARETHMDDQWGRILFNYRNYAQGNLDINHTRRNIAAGHHFTE